MSTGARTSPALARSLPDRYRLERYLATGGMAAVWCAEDRVLGRLVAIKVLSDRFAQDAQAVRRFKREARAVARVSAHPNVVTIFDVGDLEAGADDEHLHPGAFIVMEYLAGGTVADALRSRAVTRDEARRWLAEAAAALDHAHARGIVHRDIKPANFLLDRDRGLHVADFGIARLQSEETITTAGELFGTAAYLSPEQALGRDATSASDRYALAVAAFELLTGGRPYTATHFAAQARQHVEDPPPRASERDPSLPPAVDGVLARGMAKDPEARYPSALAFVQALEAALDDEPTARTRVLRPVAAKGPPARAAAAGAAAVGAGVVGAGAVGAAAVGAASAATANTRRLSNRSTLARPGASPMTPVSGSRPGSGRVLAFVALGLVALGVALVLTQLNPSATSKRAAAVRHPTTRTATAQHKRTAAPKASHSASSSSASSTTSTVASASTSASSTAAALQSGSALQAQGHQELLAGNYSAAIPTLEQAVHAASPGSLSYAYALYDLGDALLRSGNATAAIPVLQQRLQIPNQTSTVQALLDQALRAAGQAPAATSSPPSTGGAPIPPGHDHAKGPKNNGHGGG